MESGQKKSYALVIPSIIIAIAIIIGSWMVVQSNRTIADEAERAAEKRHKDKIRRDFNNAQNFGH